MKEIQYKDFSWKTHQKNWQIKRPNVCQFELTFKCGLRCRHCYTDCYNTPSRISEELTTREIKFILDKVYDSGVIWLCFTGGDPLTRADFLEIYSYAKRKGFLVTIFTNAYSMTKEIADFLAEYPPFVIEFTINAITKELYEEISQTKGSYEKMMAGLGMMLDKGLPLKIKTQITKDNFKEKDNIKKFIEGLGFVFRPSILLYPRLNGDTAPCALRVGPDDILGLDSKTEPDCLNQLEGLNKQDKEESLNTTDNNLFRCAVGGGDGFHVDPYGNMFLCNLIREPSVNLLKENIEDGTSKITPFFKNRKFETDSECRTCSVRNICYNCPGNAYLEKGNKEAAVMYHCELTAKLRRGGRYAVKTRVQT